MSEDIVNQTGAKSFNDHTNLLNEVARTDDMRSLYIIHETARQKHKAAARWESHSLCIELQEIGRAVYDRQKFLIEEYACKPLKALAEPPKAVDGLKRDATVWYDENFGKGITMPSDREVLWSYIDYITTRYDLVKK